jgi:tRNA (guanine-N7-)-methyltransferase
MSRVPLRQEPAGLSLRDKPGPLAWAQEFGREGPLELEIGCGAGGFALGYCQAHPEVNYVAFEWRKKYAREVLFRAQKHQLGNLKVIEGDAKLYVPKLFAQGSLRQIHLQFPDPWWKRAHFKRAILDPEFTLLLISLLEPGGVFEMRTDVEERARQMLATLEAAGLQNPLGKGVFHPRLPDEVASTRERRYLVSGEPVYRARLVRP